MTIIHYINELATPNRSRIVVGYGNTQYYDENATTGQICIGDGDFSYLSGRLDEDAFCCTSGVNALDVIYEIDPAETTNRSSVTVYSPSGFQYNYDEASDFGCVGTDTFGYLTGRYLENNFCCVSDCSGTESGSGGGTGIGSMFIVG